MIAALSQRLAPQHHLVRRTVAAFASAGSSFEKSSMLAYQAVSESREIKGEHMPHNFGSMDKRNPDVGTGLAGCAGSDSCHDVIRVQIECDEQDRVTNACFQTRCSSDCQCAIACTSYTTEWVKGRFIKDVSALMISDLQIVHKSLPQAKQPCVQMAEDALRAAVHDMTTKRAAQLYERQRFLAELYLLTSSRC